ncbi:MAG: methionyl-tRNA formyltransferase [Gammaproteobacteria bacterium]|nr:methionyl-tRNA formyltransferase [Gammaproteobacteria bacterium]
MRIAFAGTPEFAATILSGLADTDMNITCVITQPDRKTGRGQKRLASPVKITAEALGLKTWQPETLNTVSAQEKLQSLALDFLVVAAYGLILPNPILNTPKQSCINVHASLLPRWRGAAPIERSILAGDTETGICIMRMEEGLDTGPVYARATCPIGPRTTTEQLEGTLAKIGIPLLLDTLAHADSWLPSKQSNEGVSYAKKIGREDARIDWTGQAQRIALQVRALAHRMPPTAVLADTRMLLLAAEPHEEIKTGAPQGSIIKSDKTGIYVACNASTLRITKLRLNKGKGGLLSPQQALNGYPALFSPGQSLNSHG